MADNDEKENKTEEPTEKRRSETLEREGGPSSREVGSAAVLLIIAVFLATATLGLFTNLAQSLAVYIENPGNWHLNSGEDAVQLLQTHCYNHFQFCRGICRCYPHCRDSSCICLKTPQGSLRTASCPIFQGYHRRRPWPPFSSQALIEFFKGLVKIGMAAFAAYAAIGGIVLDCLPSKAHPMPFLN